MIFKCVKCGSNCYTGTMSVQDENVFTICAVCTKCKIPKTITITMDHTDDMILTTEQHTKKLCCKECENHHFGIGFSLSNHKNCDVHLRCLICNRNIYTFQLHWDSLDLISPKSTTRISIR